MVRRRVSQSDIARAAGVSRVTVSHILAGRDESTPETRRRVLEAAEKLRYRPNLLVRGMRTGRTHCVGVILPPGNNIFLVQVAHGIHDELVRFDSVPITLWTSRQPEYNANELQQIHRLVDRCVDGVILWPSDLSVPDEHFREIWDRNIPLVTVDRETGTHADHVGTDEAHGGRVAAEHLLELGHRHVAVLPPGRSAPMVKRSKAFAEAIEAAGGTCHAIQVRDGIPRAIEELLSLNPRPTAAFAASDYIAARAYKPLLNRGLRLPQDLSIVGYADLPFAGDLIPALTTLHQDGYAIGRMAARMLLDRITSGSVAEPRREYLKPQLVVRDSTAAPAAALRPPLQASLS